MFLFLRSSVFPLKLNDTTYVTVEGNNTMSYEPILFITCLRKLGRTLKIK